MNNQDIEKIAFHKAPLPANDLFSKDDRRNQSIVSITY